MRVRERLATWLSTLLLAFGTEGANYKPADKPGNAEAGRELALLACAVCHVVAANQPFVPLLTGAPDFLAIANRPDTNDASLRRRLTTLPRIPSKGQMGNPELTDEHLADVVAYIMSMRQQRTN
jgi:mono/diheme cytochrome c family protein